MGKPILMYPLSRRVWVKDQKFLGEITERNWMGKPRHAVYIVREIERVWVPNEQGFYHLDWRHTGYDYQTGPSNLRAADYQCECCNRWLPISTLSNHPEIFQCFLCRQADIAEYGYSRRVAMPVGWRPVPDTYPPRPRRLDETLDET